VPSALNNNATLEKLGSEPGLGDGDPPVPMLAPPVSVAPPVIDIAIFSPKIIYFLALMAT
jgi:hypothetical protein